jgi:hypothetical protein
MSKNREIAEAFAAQFDPPLHVVQTQRINGVPHRDAYLVAVFDPKTGWGITMHAFAGQLHAFIEVQGEQAEAAGKLMAKWLADARGNQD